jgi:hypothetical protein
MSELNQFHEKRIISLSTAGDREMPDAFERRRQVRRTFQGRVSCDKLDRGYENYTNLIRDGYKIRIFLNDVEQAHCLIADPDEGWIMRHQVAGGKPVFVGGVARTEIVKGNVSIRLERQFPAG